MAGNMLIAQGGGPTPVINASLAGAVAEAQHQNDIDKIYAARWGVEGMLREDFIDLTEMNDVDLELLRNTPSSAIGTCRYKVTEEDHPKILGILEKYRIGYFFYNGGNDSMDTCNKISGIAGDIRVVGIPKTIDNDLALIDHCPGYGSAARYTGITTLELGLDIQALPIHVCVVEFMGRNTGWITAASALARRQQGDPPHLIYLPELPFNEDRFLSDIQDAWNRKHGVVVAVSEGLADENGEMIVSPKHQSAIDGFGHALPGNCSQYLAELVSEKLGIRSRSEKPGLIGRTSKLLVSDVDRNEAFNVGKLAVASAARGETDRMAGFTRKSSSPYDVEYTMFELAKVANVEKKMPERFIAKNGNDVTEEFLEYCRPLIGGPIPEYFRVS